MMIKEKEENKDVLVAVLKSKRDLALLFKERWYRIPVEHAPTKKFKYVALYQPAAFGAQGRRIRYYAEVAQIKTERRLDLLPQETAHPKANEQYLRIFISAIIKLPKPIKNTSPRRVSFGFTTLERLLSAKNILELYAVAPTEEIVRDALRRARIAPVVQYNVSGTVNGARKRYRLDFALICNWGGVAIECDNRKAHAGKAQKARDKIKDQFLSERGWVVVRLLESEILNQPLACIDRVRAAIERCGGLVAISSQSVASHAVV